MDDKEGGMDRFTMSFAGSLHPTAAEHLKVVLDWVQRKDAEIRFIGAVPLEFYREIKSNWLDTVIVIADYMPTSRLERYLCSSHLLLHPLPKINKYTAIGEKIYPYLRLDKFILILEQQDNPELQELARVNSKVKLFRYDDVDGINKWLDSIHEFTMEF